MDTPAPSRSRKRSASEPRQPEIQIDFNQYEIYEIGALIMSLLTYPSDKDVEKREEVYNSLCHHALVEQHLAHPNDTAAILVTPQYVFQNLKNADKQTAFAQRRLQDRLVAARIAMAFLLNAGSDGAPPLPKGVQSISANAMAAYVAEDAGQSDPGNLKTRIWRPSWPIIHVACAISAIFQDMHRQKKPYKFSDLLLNRGLIERILLDAEGIERLISENKRFPVNPEMLIRLRVAST